MKRIADKVSEFIPGITFEFRGKAKVAIHCADEIMEIDCRAQEKITAHFLIQSELEMRRGEAGPGMVFCQEPISKNMALNLMKAGIFFIDSQGHCFFKGNRFFVFYYTQEKAKAKTKPDRAFRKAGLKLIGALLGCPGLVQESYRKAAQISGISLGSVKEIYEDLSAKDFLRGSGSKRALVNLNRLLEQWVERYNSALRPGLLIGRYEFLKPEDRKNWKISLENSQIKAFISGEMAMELCSSVFTAQILSIYINPEDRNSLLKNLRLKPSPNGSVELLQRFWSDEIPGFETRKESGIVFAPKVVIYSDLHSDPSSRNQEAAKAFYGDHLENLLV